MARRRRGRCCQGSAGVGPEAGDGGGIALGHAAGAAACRRGTLLRAFCGGDAPARPFNQAACRAAALATDGPHALRRRRREPRASGAAARTGTGRGDSPPSPASAGRSGTVTSPNGCAVSEPTGSGVRSPHWPLPTTCAPDRQGLAPPESCSTYAEVNRACSGMTRGRPRRASAQAPTSRTASGAMPPYRGVGGVCLPRDGTSYAVLKQALGKIPRVCSTGRPS